jgi:hypothetical protein
MLDFLKYFYYQALSSRISQIFAGDVRKNLLYTKIHRCTYSTTIYCNLLREPAICTSYNLIKFEQPGKVDRSHKTHLIRSD